MSYDYMLMKGAAGCDLTTLMEEAMDQVVGTVDEVKAAISQVFPATRWTQGPGAGWAGRSDDAEVTFLVVDDNLVRILHMARCEREAVVKVAQALGLVAVDEQSMEAFGQ